MLDQNFWCFVETRFELKNSCFQIYFLFIVYDYKSISNIYICNMYKKKERNVTIDYIYHNIYEME